MIWVVSNQLSACIQSTLSMYQIDFSLTWIDLYRLDFQFVLKRASSSTPFRLIEVDQILPMDYMLPRPQLRSILPEVNSYTGKLANSLSHLLGSSQVVSPTGQFRPLAVSHTISLISIRSRKSQYYLSSRWMSLSFSVATFRRSSKSVFAMAPISLLSQMIGCRGAVAKTSYPVLAKLHVFLVAGLNIISKGYLLVRVGSEAQEVRVLSVAMSLRLQISFKSNKFFFSIFASTVERKAIISEFFFLIIFIFTRGFLVKLSHFPKTILLRLVLEFCERT